VKRSWSAEQFQSHPPFVEYFTSISIPLVSFKEYDEKIGGLIPKDGTIPFPVEDDASPGSTSAPYRWEE